MRLTSDDIDAICELVYELCGVYLDESKGYLIESRLGELVKRSGCSDYVELVRKVRFADNPDLCNQVIDAITTNETLFFRDATLFDALRERILPELIAAKATALNPKRIRVWSAGCSTGQEPYSIAMVLSELLPDAVSWDIRILGTDVSEDAIRRAGRGWYSNLEVGRGLSLERLGKFFQREAGGWRVNEELRRRVGFEHNNLLEPFSASAKYDLVFCRNVAIYFTPDTRRELFGRIALTLLPGGLLFAGSQESLADLGPCFAPHHVGRAVCYRPNWQLV